MALSACKKPILVVCASVLSAQSIVDMATQQQNKEQFADLITCSVCLDEFNQKQRAPKFLPCSHTICLDCLKVSVTNFSKQIYEIILIKIFIFFNFEKKSLS